MPRYFFHRTNGFVDHDKDGTELADVHAARVQATIFAGECLREQPDCVWNGQDFRVEVTDEHGRLLFTVITRAIEASASISSERARE